jgi:hypothetical protein
MPTRKPAPPPEPEPPHGALGEIREIIPFRKSHRDVPVPKARQRSKPSKKGVRRSMPGET